MMAFHVACIGNANRDAVRNIRNNLSTLLLPHLAHADPDQYALGSKGNGSLMGSLKSRMKGNACAGTV